MIAVEIKGGNDPAGYDTRPDSKIMSTEIMLITVADHGLINTALSSVGSRLILSYTEFVHLWLMLSTGATNVNLSSLSSTWLSTPRFRKHLMPMVMVIKLMPLTFSLQMVLKIHGSG